MKLECLWKLASILDLKWNMCLYSVKDDTFVSRSIYNNGQWEGKLVSKMITTMRKHPNSTLLDIGGNIGYYTLAAAAAGFDVNVFEPVPTNAAMIQQSIYANNFNTIKLHTVALGKHTGEFGMGKSLQNQGGVRHEINTKSSTMLPVSQMDNILKDEARPLYIKMDIEGGECFAIEGMKRYLSGASQIIGVNMEFGQSRKNCCVNWIQPGNFFHLLKYKHNLCPHMQNYETICESHSWDLLWIKCDETKQILEKQTHKVNSKFPNKVRPYRY